MKFETESSSGAGNSSLRGADGDEAIHKEHTQELMSAAQLVVKTAGVNVKDPIVTVCNVCDCPGEPPCPPPCNGVCDTPNCPPCPIINQLHQKIRFGQFRNVSGRGIFFDNSQPASVQNQINVVNTNQGRFTSIYPDSGDFFQINIGEFRKNSSVAQASVDAAGRRIDPNNIEFASVTFQPDPPLPGTKVNITVNEQKVDIVPRGRKVYMTAQKDFHVKGRLIPKGTILIGTLAPGSNVSKPKFGDLSSIRAYSPQNGALMQIFTPGDRSKRDCSGGGECMEVDQFEASGSNPNLIGSEIRTSFSSDDLFPGVDAHTANTRFVNIQQDLEANSNMGIYKPNFDWQKDILRDDLNAEQKTLITETLQKYNPGNPNDFEALLDLLGLNFSRSSDSFVNDLQGDMQRTFVNFVWNKGKSFDGKVDKGFVKDLKDVYVGYRDLYQDYMKARIGKKKAEERYWKLRSKEDTSTTANNDDDSSGPGDNSNDNKKDNNKNNNSGKKNTGGKKNNGGKKNTGGKKNNGGKKNTGGKKNNGGKKNTGGKKNNGGKKNTGGKKNNGGKKNTGGKKNNGGKKNGGKKNKK